MSKDVWMWLVDTTQRSGRYTHTQTMRIPYYMAIQNGGGVVEGVGVFFFPVQWPQQPQLSLQSCLGVHNWACAADQQQKQPLGLDVSCCCSGVHESTHHTVFTAVVINITFTHRRHLMEDSGVENHRVMIFIATFVQRQLFLEADRLSRLRTKGSITIIKISYTVNTNFNLMLDL